jgi:hypothetical protein
VETDPMCICEPKIGRECISVQRGVGKCSGSAWVDIAGFETWRAVGRSRAGTAAMVAAGAAVPALVLS